MALLLQDRLLPGVAELVPELEEIRHDIHAHPSSASRPSAPWA